MTARKTAVAAIATQKVDSTANYLEHAGEDIYGSYVFGDEAQRQYLPKPVYKKLRRTIEGLESFDPSIADKRHSELLTRLDALSCAMATLRSQPAGG